MDKFKQNKFQAWLTRVGDEEAAVLLKITPRSAAAYRRGERVPKLKNAYKAIDLFREQGKRLTLADIYSHE